MTYEEMVQKLLAFQPDAIDIRAIGDCHCGAWDSQLFYVLPEFPATEQLIRGELMIVGGIFCTACNFGNAGSVPMELYENAPRLDPDATEKLS